MVKVGGVIATILSIVLIIAAVMLARDAIDLQQNMKTGDKKFLCMNLKNRKPLPFLKIFMI